jgi:hypothetical protein
MTKTTILCVLTAIGAFAQVQTPLTVMQSAGSATGAVRLQERRSNGQHYAAIAAPESIASSFTLTLPSALPATSGECIASTTAGVLSFQNTCIGDPATLSLNNTDHRLQLQHPDSTSATWDSQPLAAIYIDGPASATTRNFLAGIWVVTNGNAIDKGRGIGIQNIGKSDSLYIQNEGTDSTGQAIYLTPTSTGSTGLVLSTTLATHQGLVARQETNIDPSAAGVLAVFEANGAATEMVRLNSDVNSQVGIISRMVGNGSLPIVIKDAMDAQVASVDSLGQWFGQSYILQGDGFLSQSSGWPNLRSPAASGIFIDYGSGGILFRNRDQSYRTDWSIDNSSHLIPGTTAASDIGSSSLVPRNIYAGSIITGLVGPVGATDLVLRTDNTARWVISSTGLLYPNVNDSLDIGESSLPKRVRAIYGRFGDFAATGTTGDYVSTRTFRVTDLVGGAGYFQIQAGGSAAGAAYLSAKDQAGSRLFVADRAVGGVAANTTRWYSNFVPAKRLIANGDAVDDANLPDLGASGEEWKKGWFTDIAVSAGTSDITTTGNLSAGTVSITGAGLSFSVSGTTILTSGRVLAGIASVNQDWSPTTTETYALGAVGAKWNNLFTANANLYGSTYIKSGGNLVLQSGSTFTDARCSNNGYVLTSDGSGVITCQAPAAASLPAVDTTSIVEGSADGTKELRFEVDGFTTGTVRVLTPQNADYTIAGTNIAQTFSAAQTFSGSTITASSTFSSDLIATSGSTYALGSSSVRWLGYMNTLNVNGAFTMTGTVTGDWNPTSTNTYTLGSASAIWNMIRTEGLRIHGGSASPSTNDNGSLGGSTLRWTKTWTKDLDITGTVTPPSGTAFSGTKTVRASGGASDCTLTFSAGIMTGGTC